jgi:hypothetical protein
MKKANLIAKVMLPVLILINVALLVVNAMQVLAHFNGMSSINLYENRISFVWSREILKDSVSFEVPFNLPHIDIVAQESHPYAGGSESNKRGIQWYITALDTYEVDFYWTNGFKPTIEFRCSTYYLGAERQPTIWECPKY